MPELKSGCCVEQRFRMPEQQVPSITQRSVKGFDNPFFGNLVEIYNYVPAENYIHFSQENGAVFVEQVQMTYGDQAFHFVDNPEGPVVRQNNA
jgi:hypothetical protein